MSRDPFGEEEVTYLGPKKTPDKQPISDDSDWEDESTGTDLDDAADPFGDTDDNHTNAPTTQDDDDDDPFGPEPEDSAYDLDGDETDNFDFEDEPQDWEPTVTPDTAANRTASATARDKETPERPAHTRPTPSAVQVDSSSLSTPAPQDPAPAPAPVSRASEPPKPRHRTPAPEVSAKANRSWKDRILGLFRGKNTEEPVNDEMRSLQRSIPGTINVAFINRKGGVGKTLTTTLTGMTLAHHRNDHVIAVDASPEGGELGDRVEREQYGSVRSLIRQLDAVKRYSHVRTHTSQDQTGLEVLGSDPEAVGEPELTPDEYRALMSVMRDYYQFILTDCAQGINTPVMEAVLDEADVLVLVSEGADGMRSATWVASQLADENGPYGDRYAHLVDDMVVVVTQRTAQSNVDMGKVADHFRTFARKVVELPYDQAIEGGGAFTLDDVAQSTLQAGLDVATAITTSNAFQEGGR